MKKPIAQLSVGDKVFVRVGRNNFKSACEVKKISFNDIGEENENATILFDDGIEQHRQNWYVTELIEVIV